MRLGGWHRLWIGVSALYLVIVALITWISWPTIFTRWHTDAIYDLLKPEGRQKLVSDETRDVLQLEASNHHILRFPRSMAREEWEPVGNDYQAALAKVVAREQRQLLVNSLLWWIIPVGFLYALGRLVGWVYRGFRPRTW